MAERKGNWWMMCPKCAADDFTVVKVKRGMRLSSSARHWVVDDEVDSRLVLCSECGARYWTETRFAVEIRFDDVRMKQMEIPLK